MWPRGHSYRHVRASARATTSPAWCMAAAERCGMAGQKCVRSVRAMPLEGGRPAQVAGKLRV
eukprot:1265009-Alexandrium_andersonii.AAC.1